MPLVRISLRRGKPAAHLSAVVDGVYAALRETFDVPDDDRFIVVDQHDEGEFVYGARYLGFARSDDLVIIQLTVTNRRSREQKQALYRAIAQRLATSPGLRADDIFINVVEVAAENWSFGAGVAQYA
ncbi:tautomerase family protein [Chelatococcus reniformis]|uniref:Tautomerase family protein n=1 Tax=Chelatococcus reniformis TaxID=1494448 RepID=A0A916XHH5_9HYPH|nr:tautomerase family protein [Chelatococcus reniformis]GGC73675.1 tautomerase family protein [Chelatococcus reniformis]